MPKWNKISGTFGPIRGKYLYPIVYGGTLSTSGNYFYRTFTANNTLKIENATLAMEYILVGAGGNNNVYTAGWSRSAGGGGGEVKTGSVKLIGSFNITIGQIETTDVYPNSGKGGSSSISGDGLSITSLGGNGGNSIYVAWGGNSGNGYSGGSGYFGPRMYPSYSYDGGGAGATQAGQNAGPNMGANGGNGYQWVDGVYYAGGGRGVSYRDPDLNGQGGYTIYGTDGLGATNYGGGAGSQVAKNGVFIIRYLKSAVGK